MPSNQRVVLAQETSQKGKRIGPIVFVCIYLSLRVHVWLFPNTNIKKGIIHFEL